MMIVLNNNQKPNLIWLCLFLLLTCNSIAQNCNDIPAASDFKVETLASNFNSIGMDIDVAADGKVYWIERFGEFKVYDPSSGNTTLIAKLDVLYGTSYNPPDNPGWDEQFNEGGLQGLALDLDFENNHWVYLYYSVKVPNIKLDNRNATDRLARFTLTNNKSQLDLSSEKIIWENKIYGQCCHHGGDLFMDEGGNIWLSTGDNINPTLTNQNPLNDQLVYRDVGGTSGNSNDTRGKTHRLKPIPIPNTHPKTDWGEGKTYTIPNGNFKDRWASMYNNTELDKILPTIYTIGHRNPWSIAVHYKRNWLAIGEAAGNGNGPAKGWDEVNMAVEPGFFGWPFFNGKNLIFQPENVGVLDPQVPENISVWNTGVKNYPPAVPAMDTRQGGWCFGMAAAFISFDSTLKSDIKFPPSMDGVLLGGGFSSGGRAAYLFNNDGSLKEKRDGIYPFVERSRSGKQGPDGALYLVKTASAFNGNGGSSLQKISYTGTCNPEPIEPVFKRKLNKHLFISTLSLFHFGNNTNITLPEQAIKVQAFNLDGKMVWQFHRGNKQGNLHTTISLEATNGVLLLKFYN